MRLKRYNHFLGVYPIPFLFVLFVISVSSVWSAKAKSVDVRMDAYFKKLEKRIESFARSKRVTSSKLVNIDAFFREILIDNPEITSILRTNSKGKVLSEFTRNKKFKRNYRSIANQKIFKQIKSSGHPYYKVLGGTKRAALLMWGMKIGTSKRFNGILVVKIDMITSLHQFAKTTKTPFLARTNGKLIYSHLWEGRSNPMENFVDVPGLKEMIISFGGEKIEGAGLQIASASVEEEKTKAPEKPMSRVDSILSDAIGTTTKDKSRKKMGDGTSADKKPAPDPHDGKPMTADEKSVPVPKVQEKRGGSSFGLRKQDKSPNMLYGILGLVGFFVILGLILAIKSKREEESIL